jgi:hypothetical protein
MVAIEQHGIAAPPSRRGLSEPLDDGMTAARELRQILH